MNNGRVRKSPNTLIRAYKKKNRERNIILQCIVVSVVVVSLVIISLIHGKFQADKLKNQYQDGKTISTFIEEGTDTIKRQLQDLSYVNSVGEEKESGRLMNGRYSYSKCVVLDETAYEDMVKPTFARENPFHNSAYYLIFKKASFAFLYRSNFLSQFDLFFAFSNTSKRV